MVSVARKVTRSGRGQGRGRADRVCLAGLEGILAQAATAFETGNTNLCTRSSLGKSWRNDCLTTREGRKEQGGTRPSLVRG